MNVFVPLLLFVFCNSVIFAEDSLVQKTPVVKRNTFGFGMGIDYGGFGCRATLCPTNNIGLFGAGGYNLVGLGFNAGAIFRIAPNDRACPYLGAMYGYNAVIKINGANQYDKIYFGPSFNFGIEIWAKKTPNCFNIGIIYPVRSSGFYDDLAEIKKNSQIILYNEPGPVTISIGFHFGL